MKITYSWRIIQQVLSSYMYTMRAGNGLSYRLRVVGSIPLCYGLATCVGKLAVYVCVLGCRGLHMLVFGICVPTA